LLTSPSDDSASRVGSPSASRRPPMRCALNFHRADSRAKTPPPTSESLPASSMNSSPTVACPNPFVSTVESFGTVALSTRNSTRWVASRKTPMNGKMEPDLRHLKIFKDRHGRWRIYVRRPGYKRCPLPAPRDFRGDKSTLSNNLDFLAAHHAAMSESLAPLKP